jgi:hypothetical protein
MKYLRKILKEPEMAGIYLMVLTARLWPAELYLKCYYYLHLHEWPNLKHPQNFTEKLNWLKLHDRRPLYTKLADKCEVKKYVSEKIGSDKIIPLLGVWDHFDEIDFDQLPDQFVLKCTHDSGGFWICKDRSIFNQEEARQFFNKELRKNYYWNKREWVYKDIKPRIIAEPYIDSLGKPESFEYKLTCMNGVCKVFTICTGIAHSEFELRTNDHYDRDFNHLPWYAYYKNSKKPVQIPPQAKEIIEYAEKLSEGIPQVRVDFYVINDKVYFGEMTFYTWAGIIEFTPPEWNDIMGSWLDLKS